MIAQRRTEVCILNRNASRLHRCRVRVGYSDAR
jgi:hypothetical protein